MKTRHIAFLTLAMECGGTERAIAALCNYFVSKGEAVTLFVLTGETSFYPLDPRVNAVFFHSTLTQGASLRRGMDILSRAKQLRQAIKKANPDLLIGMSTNMSAYALFGTVLTKIKSVGTERNNPYRYKNSRYMRLLRRTTALLCDGYVFQTNAAMQYYPASMHRKAAVIPNAIFNDAVFSLSPPSVREKTITAMGRLTAQKGFDTLLKAFFIVRGKEHGVTLKIFGEGDERPHLEEEIVRLGLKDCVFLPGAMPDAIGEVARSSVFVLSSRYEGMPNALLEALACGVPCVSTDCQMGPAELIDDHGNGILVPVDDAETMANAILEILQDPALSKRLSENAMLLRERYTVEAVGRQWLDYLLTL